LDGEEESFISNNTNNKYGNHKEGTNAINGKNGTDKTIECGCHFPLYQERIL